MRTGLSRRRALLLAGAAGMSAALPRAARAEASQVRGSYQHGIGHLVPMVMERDRLVEKHLAAAGLGHVEVGWTQFSGASAVNDAILSGSIEFWVGGIPAILQLWAKTQGTPLEFKGIAPLSAVPLYLNTRNPNIRTLADFGPDDKIAMPGVKSGAKAIVLEMAAAQAFGKENYARLDSLAVSLNEGDAMTALLSFAGPINSHFADSSTALWELETPGIHTVIGSREIMGGPASFIGSGTTARFREANPTIFRALFAAQQEATETVTKQKAHAADIFLSVTKDRKHSVADIVKLLEHPEFTYSMTPENTMKYAAFMHEVGLIRTKPASWRDYFFPEIHDLPGS